MGDSDDKRSIKLQMMISPAELRAIDAWRFRHRYGSRAEAIRTLLRRALATDGGAAPDEAA